MKVIIASDSHMRNEVLDYIEAKHPDAQYYLHCGDLEDDPQLFPNWLFVKGNNDYFGQFPKHRILDIEGHRFFIIHGDRLPYMVMKERLVELGKEHGADIVCFGHTHRSYIEKKHGILLINPGSLCFPRDGKPPCYVIMEITKEDISCEIVYEPEW